MKLILERHASRSHRSSTMGTPYTPYLWF